MWYHISFYFDYIGWRQKASQLMWQIDHEDFSTLLHQVERILDQEEKRTLLREFGCRFGSHPLSEGDLSKTNPHRNSIIGQLLFASIFNYYIPAKYQLGSNWSIVKAVLLANGWIDEEVEELINGTPISLLVGRAPLQHQVVSHTDPYWYWIRSLYSSNQGGWLSTEKVSFYNSKIANIRRKNSLVDYQNISGLSNDQILFRKISFEKGIENLWELFGGAASRGIGLYSTIFYEWDDEDI